MFASLNQPGGFLGAVTIVCAFFLFVAGVVSIVSGLGGLWADDVGGNAFIVAFGAAELLAVAGFALQPRMPVLGAVLAIVGSVAFALVWFWAIVPLVIGPVAVVAALMRAVKLGRSGTGVALAT
jgi:hypothetical protein